MTDATGGAGGTASGDGAAAAAAAAGGGQGGGAAAATWWDGIGDADLKAYAGNKAYASPAEAFAAHRSLERMIGADRAGRMVVMPADGAPAEEVNAFFDKLGRPVSADKYELDLPAEHDADLAKWFREKAHANGLSGKQAKAMLGEYVALERARAEAMHTEAGIKLERETGELRREWGSAYDGKIQAARSAVAAFGVPKETIDTLEQAMGYGGVMKFFDQIAAKIGQSSFVGGDSRAGGFGALTPAQAQSRIAELKADKAFSDRLFKKDATAKAEWDRLHVQAYGEAA